MLISSQRSREATAEPSGPHRVETIDMDDLQARAEINDAWTSIVLAEACLAQGKYKEGESAMFDAERHYRSAQSAVNIKQSGSILNNLADLRVRLYQIRSVIGRKSKTLDGAESG
jgi:hypothetical protein